MTASFRPYNQPRRFRADLVAEGAPLFLIDRGLLQVDVLLNRGGNPGLPLQQVIGDSASQTVSGIVPIRAGTNQQVDFRASNVGAAGSFLSGTYNSGQLDQSFTNLAAGQARSESINLLAQNSARGSFLADVNIDYTLPLDDFGPYVTRLELDVPVVGPLYQAPASVTAPTVLNASPGSGDAVPFSVTILNADNTPVPLSELTDLSLLTFTFQHDQPGAAFGFNPVYLFLGNPDFLLSSQESEALGLLFNPSAPGDYHSLLTIQTDANAGFGATGDTYTIDLYGTAVPEPTSLTLLGLGGLALLRRRR